MKFTVYLSFFFCFLLFGCKNTGSFRIEFEKTFEEISQTAVENNKFFGIVLSNPDCPPCDALRDFLYRDTDKKLSSKIIFNIVDISLPENKWYEQLIASKTIPTTLIFSPQGDLKAIIQGSSKAGTECILEFLNGREDCSRYLYKGIFSSRTKYENIIKAFDLLLKAKVKLVKQEDASAELKESLETLYYPYGVWLMAQNEQNNGNKENAVAWANRMLTFREASYAVLYPDLYMEARRIIDPQFNPADMPALEIEKNVIDLGECKTGKGIDFSIRLRNAGKDTLFIHDVSVSCSCLKLHGKNSYAIEAYGEARLDLTFTANDTGDIERKIVLTTNEPEAVRTITVSAHANE